MNNLEAAAANIARWRRDPVAFVREQFNVEPDEWQKDFLIAFNTQQRIAAKACKGPGKTTVLAWCAWLFLATRPHPKIAATSISGDNLRDGLWSEMAKWQNKSAFLTHAFEWQKERIISRDHPQTWWMSARKWSKSANPEQQADTLAGLHADYILFIIDEAGGVPDSVVAAAEAALATGIECKLLLCGNPTHLSGPLYRACTKEKSLWYVIEITGDPDDPKRSPRISVKWAREQIMKYGRDNPWVLVNVFGKFPPSSLNSLLGPDDMSAAMARILRDDAYNFAPKILGVDVARQGDDRTVIAPRQGLAAFMPKILRIPDTQQVAAIVAQSIQKWKPDGVMVDGTGGWGAGVIDALRNWGYDVTEVQFAGKALDRQFVNKRAEMSFELAKWVKGGGCLPNLPELTEEATAITYFYQKDQFQIVEKLQVKEAIGRSPDLWDAYGLTFAFPVVKKLPGALSHLANNASAASDYNPLAQYHSQQAVADYNPLG